MSKIILAVVGSREYPRLADVEDYLDNNIEDIKSIVTGGARGVDHIAELWAFRKGIHCDVIYPVDPDDKFSYLLRNVEIISHADKVVAFHFNDSKGTAFTIGYAKARGKPCEVIHAKNEPESEQQTLS